MAAFSNASFSTSAFGIAAFDFGPQESAYRPGGWPKDHKLWSYNEQDIKDAVKKQRIELGIIPDDVPQKAVEVIEQAVVKAVSRDEPIAIEQSFELESVDFKEIYAEYYKAVLEVMQERSKHRRKRMMVFALMNE
jgi:NADH/NAD ratio-sensing transcriptional regulator Rex